MRREFIRTDNRCGIAATRLCCADVPVHVARDEQIEVAVVVVIEESSRHRPAATCDACLRCHIRKGAVAIVAV